LKGRNRPEKTIYTVKNTDFFKFGSKNWADSLGKVN